MSQELKKRFVVTLKSVIKLSIPRVDGTPLILKTNTLLVDWPCRMKPTAETPDDIEPREGPHVDLTVIRFVEDGAVNWYEFWKRADGLTEPMPVQIKRDNILSQQEVAPDAQCAGSGGV